jgi:hypothetical protein
MALVRYLCSFMAAILKFLWFNPTMPSHELVDSLPIFSQSLCSWSCRYMDCTFQFLIHLSVPFYWPLPSSHHLTYNVAWAIIYQEKYFEDRNGQALPWEMTCHKLSVLVCPKFYHSDCNTISANRIPNKEVPGSDVPSLGLWSCASLFTSPISVFLVELLDNQVR